MCRGCLLKVFPALALGLIIRLNRRHYGVKRNTRAFIRRLAS